MFCFFFERHSLSVCVRSGRVVQRCAASLIQIVDTGPGAHQSKQALVVAIGSSIVQRGPGKGKHSLHLAKHQRRGEPVNRQTHRHRHTVWIRILLITATDLPKLSFLLKSAPVLSRRLRHSRFLKSHSSNRHQDTRPFIKSAPMTKGPLQVLTLRLLQRVNTSSQSRQECQYQILHQR